MAHHPRPGIVHCFQWHTQTHVITLTRLHNNMFIFNIILYHTAAVTIKYYISHRHSYRMNAIYLSTRIPLSTMQCCNITILRLSRFGCGVIYDYVIMLGYVPEKKNNQGINPK